MLPPTGREMHMRDSRGWVTLALLFGAACNSFDGPASDNPPFVNQSPSAAGKSSAGPVPQPPLNVGGSFTLPIAPVLSTPYVVPVVPPIAPVWTTDSVVAGQYTIRSVVPTLVDQNLPANLSVGPATVNFTY